MKTGTTIIEREEELEMIADIQSKIADHWREIFYKAGFGENDRAESSTPYVRYRSTRRKDNGPMTHYDIFNGDADGLCALVQLRLQHPAETSLVTGVKRDIQLLDRVTLARAITSRRSTSRSTATAPNCNGSSQPARRSSGSIIITPTRSPFILD